MSFSTESTTNPAKFKLEVKNGQVQYFDKELGENVKVEEPFEFIVLDTLGKVKGWSDEDGSGYWSNEVRNSGDEPFTIRTNKGVKATGLWRDIKGQTSISGAKFYSSIYLAHKSEEGYVISNFSLTGAALNAWIEFSKANRSALKKNKAVLDGWEDAKKGAVNYKTPVFTLVPLTDEEISEAKRLDGELQEYFKSYFNRDAPQKPEDDFDEDEPIDLENIPF